MMPEKSTVERAEKDKREGKSPSTQAGEFVREEMHHVREGKHGARSPEQAIAIGLSKARSAGVKLRAPRKGKASAKTRRNAKLALKRARSRKKKPSPKRLTGKLFFSQRQGDLPRRGRASSFQLRFLMSGRRSRRQRASTRK